MIKSIAIASAIAGLGLSVGASAFAFDEARPATSAPAAKRSCFFVSQIDGWRSENNEKTIYLDVGVKDVYRADLMMRCHDIDSALSIGVETRGGGSSICDGMDLDIIVKSSIGPQRCPVTKLTKLTPDEVQALKTKKKSR
jgi:hypothetical protein